MIVQLDPLRQCRHRLQVSALCLRRHRDHRDLDHPGRRCRRSTGQAQTRKIVTTANAQWLRPFQAEPYAIWNATTGATVTVTVYGTINAGAVPNNDDIWIEVEYLRIVGYAPWHHRHHHQGQSAGEQCGGGIGRLTLERRRQSARAGRRSSWWPRCPRRSPAWPDTSTCACAPPRRRTTYYIDPKIELT